MNPSHLPRRPSKNVLVIALVLLCPTWAPGKESADRPALAAEETKEEGKKEGEKEQPKEAKNAVKDEKTDAEQKAEKPRKKLAQKTPEKGKKKRPPVFHLHDGMRISGTPRVENLAIETAYGTLVIPREDLVRVRFAKEVDPELQKLIAIEIENLESEEFEIREQATSRLENFGAPALKKLRKAVESDDEEVKSRASKVVEYIEEELSLTNDPEDEHTMPLSGEDDEVVTVKFVIRGKISVKEFLVESKYGDFILQRKDVVSIVFQEFTPTELEFQVPGHHFAPSNNWYVSKVSVKKDTPIELMARGQIHLHNFGWSAGPDGTSNVRAKQYKNFPAAALIARIGNKGKPFLVGANFKGKANASGKLMFAIAFRGGSVSGNFTVKAQIKTKKNEEDDNKDGKAEG